MEQHIKVLGILNIVSGSLGALGGIVILIIFGGAYGIVEAVSTRQSEVAVALPVIAVVGGAIAILLLLLSAPAIIAGIGLLQLTRIIHEGCEKVKFRAEIAYVPGKQLRTIG